MDPELKKDLQVLDKSLRSSNLSTRNRLLSIIKDAEFIVEIKDTYYPDIPIIPNDRCGRWYVNPKLYKNLIPSYFKSTDGHTNNWSFSTRRLNLHLLNQINENNGIILVDSTRRGKKIPDSFSKTIPIWISIMNKFINSNSPFMETFITPIETVSKYEHDRMLDLLPDFLLEMEKFKDIVQEKIDNSLIKKKILKPFWIYPGCKTLPVFLGTEDFLPIILISASEQSQDGANKINGYTYVQGAGDDHELWAKNLTPQLFWNNYERFSLIFESTEAQVDQLIQSIVLEEKTRIAKLDERVKSISFWNDSDIVKVNDFLSFGKIERNITFNNIHENLLFDKVIVLESTFRFTKPENNCKIFKFNLDSGSKKSSKLLRSEISNIVKILNPSEKTLIVCNSGEDMSVAAVLCYINTLADIDKKNLSKETIRRDLIKLMDLKKVNPQRATLNSVNSFLLS
jgi:tRNA A64-2'-O-ribosylphosphate transferase